jgi:hypothetical protein
MAKSQFHLALTSIDGVLAVAQEVPRVLVFAGVFRSTRGAFLEGEKAKTEL